MFLFPKIASQYVQMHLNLEMDYVHSTLLEIQIKISITDNSLN